MADEITHATIKGTYLIPCASHDAEGTCGQPRQQGEEKKNKNDPAMIIATRR